LRRASVAWDDPFVADPPSAGLPLNKRLSLTISRILKTSNL
jgi:hypothetical protein